MSTPTQQTQGTFVATAQHRYAFPVERVFDAWLSPGLAGRFLFSTPEGEMVRAEIDPQVGGRYLFTDRRDGEEVDHFGEYLEIDRPRHLVFSFAVTGFAETPDRVSVAFAPDGDGCIVTVQQVMDAEWADYLERTSKGWANILAKLDEVIRSETTRYPYRGT